MRSVRMILPVAISLLLGGSLFAQGGALPSPCPFGDDGFQRVDCCTDISPNLPDFPDVFGRVAHGFFSDCGIQCDDVLSSQLYAPRFVACDQAYVDFVMTDPNGFLVTRGTLTAKYSRTWELVGDRGQVWRFLLNGYLEFFAPQLSNCRHPSGRILVTGFVDYAARCHFNYWDSSWSLHTMPSCIDPSVNPPPPSTFDTHHYVYPRTFTFAAGAPPTGLMEEEAVRESHIDVWPTRVTCQAEAPLVDGIIADRSFGCLCNPGAGFDWVNQHILGSTRCAGTQAFFQTIPFATPYFPAGAVSRYIGFWSAGLHRDLTVTYGYLQYDQHCQNTGRRDFVAGVSTRTEGRLFPSPIDSSLGPVEHVFTDLANLMKPANGTNPYGYVSDIVYNLNPR